MFGSTVYVSAGNIHVSGTGSEIKDLVAWAGKLAGANDAAAAGNAYAQFFRELTPQSAVDSIQDLAWSNNALHAQLNIAGTPVSAALSADSVTVTAAGWTVHVTITGTSGSATTLTPTSGDYVTLSQLQPFAPVLERYVGAQAMGMDATVSVNGYSLDTELVLSLGKPVAARAVSQILGRNLTVTFWNDRVYIDYGWHHVEASMNSLERALYAVLTITPGVDRQTVQNAIEAYTYFFEHLSFASVVGAISEFGYADGALNITANIAASPLYISLTPSRITLRTQVDAASLAVRATQGTNRISPSWVRASPSRTTDTKSEAKISHPPTGSSTSRNSFRQALRAWSAPREFPRARYWAVRLDTAAVSPTAVRDSTTAYMGMSS